MYTQNKSYRKNIENALILFVLIIFWATSSIACTCDSPYHGYPLKEQVRLAKQKADAVFLGQAIDFVTKIDSPGIAIKFRVAKSWKLVSTKEVIIFTPFGNGSCGYHFIIGKQYLIYASEYKDGTLNTNICKGTALSAKAEKGIKLLGTELKLEVPKKKL
jgi:hypothetical protein